MAGLTVLLLQLKGHRLDLRSSGDVYEVCTSVGLNHHHCPRPSEPLWSAGPRSPGLHRLRWPSARSPPSQVTLELIQKGPLQGSQSCRTPRPTPRASGSSQGPQLPTSTSSEGSKVRAPPARNLPRGRASGNILRTGAPSAPLTDGQPKAQNRESPHGLPKGQS